MTSTEKNNEPNHVEITAHIEIALYQRIIASAEREHVTVNEWVNRALNEYCEREQTAKSEHMQDQPERYTYFGLPIVDGCYVRREDIEKLPFYDFWSQSAIGSTFLVKNDVDLIYLLDWVNFVRLFIKTGRHRFQPR